MGVNVSNQKYGLDMNWLSFDAMELLLRRHGFKGKLPMPGNAHTAITKRDARAISRAALRFYMAKSSANNCAPPPLKPIESTLLAYALLVCFAEGKVKHS